MVQFYPEERVQFHGTEIDRIGHVVTNIHQPTHSLAVTEGPAQCQSRGQSGVKAVKRTELTRLFTVDLSGPGGETQWLEGVAVSREGEIAVADRNNHRILITDITGQCKRTPGRCGDKPGEFCLIHGVAFTSAGDIVVVDGINNRVQVLNKDSGDVIRCFGSHGSAAGQFSHPEGVSVDSSDRIIVTDSCNHRVQVFSSTGEFLFKFGDQLEGEQKLDKPARCVNVNNVFIVSDTCNCCIEVFDTNGNFLYKIGGIGSENGKFICPIGLAVDGKGNLFVCDSMRGQVLMMTVDGQFITTTTCELEAPVRNAAVLHDGKIVVTELGNPQLSVLQLNGNE